MERVFVFVQTFLAGLQDQLRDGMQDQDRDRGAGLVEYALLVSFIAIVAIAGLTVFGGNISTFFTNLSSRITK